MEIRGLLQASATLPLGDKPPILIQYDAVKEQQSVWMLWIIDKSLTFPGNQTLTPRSSNPQPR